MKKLFVFLLLAIMAVPVLPQTGTILDKETYIQVNYPSGDTLTIGKDQVVYLKTYDSQVYVMTSQRWAADQITRLISIRPTDFGFASAGTLRNYLSGICYKSYSATYHYTSGNIDTVSFYTGDSLAYRMVYTYTEGVITGKSAPINE